MRLLAFAIVAAIIVAAGCVEFGTVGKPVLKLEAKTGPYYDGETVLVAVSAKNSDKIRITFGEETETVACDSGTDCYAERQFTPKPGIYKVRVLAAGAGGEIEQSATITVLESLAKCIGNTPEGKCAKEKPKMCVNGKFEEKCSVCGCEPGNECAGEVCVAEMPNAIKLDAEYPKKIGEGVPFKARAKITFDGPTSSGKFTAKAELGGVSFSKEFSPDTAGSNEYYFELEFPALKKGVYDLYIKIYRQSEANPKINYFQAKAIEAVEKGPRLSAPQGLSGFSEGKDIILSWSPVMQAESYKIYKSSDANPAFISYQLKGSAPGTETSYVLQAQNPGSHFFIITAADIFGVESEYSQVAVVNVR